MDFLNSSNSSNITTSNQTFRITASIIYALLCLAGLIGYGLYCYVVIKNRKTLANPFYSFTLSLAVPDCLCNFFTLLFAVPALLATETGSSTDLAPFWLQHIYGFLSDHAWFVVASHMVLIASNRVISIKWPLSYNRLFSKSKVAIVIIGCYVWAIVIPTISYSCRCRYVFVDYAWNLICNDKAYEQCSNSVLLLDQTTTNAQMAFVIICNIFILFHVYLQGKKFHQTDKKGRRQFTRERALVLQFSAVAFVIIVGQTCFWVLPPLIEKGLCSAEIGGVVSNIFGILTFALNPFLYFTFSSEIRSRLLNKNGPSATSVDKNGTTATVHRRMTVTPVVHSIFQQK